MENQIKKKRCHSLLKNGNPNEKGKARTDPANGARVVTRKPEEPKLMTMTVQEFANLVQQALQAASSSQAETALVLKQIVDKLSILKFECMCTKRAILPELPTFDGSPESYEAWRAQAQAKLRQDGHLLGNALGQFDYFATRMTGAAANKISAFLSEHGEAGSGTPRLFFAFMDDMFGSANSQTGMVSISLLYSITQEEDEPIDRFIERFEALLCEMEDINDYAARNCFYRALRPELRAKLDEVLPCPTTLYTELRDALQRPEKDGKS